MKSKLLFLFFLCFFIEDLDFNFLSWNILHYVASRILRTLIIEMIDTSDVGLLYFTWGLDWMFLNIDNFLALKVHTSSQNENTT